MRRYLCLTRRMLFDPSRCKTAPQSTLDTLAYPDRTHTPQENLDSGRIRLAFRAYPPYIDYCGYTSLSRGGRDRGNAMDELGFAQLSALIGSKKLASIAKLAEADARLELNAYAKELRNVLITLGSAPANGAR